MNSPSREIKLIHHLFHRRLKKKTVTYLFYQIFVLPKLTLLKVWMSSTWAGPHEPHGQAHLQGDRHWQASGHLNGGSGGEFQGPGGGHQPHPEEHPAGGLPGLQGHHGSAYQQVHSLATCLSCVESYIIFVNKCLFKCVKKDYSEKSINIKKKNYTLSDPKKLRGTLGMPL